MVTRMHCREREFRDGSRPAAAILIPLVLLLIGMQLMQAPDEPRAAAELQVPEGFTIELVAGPDLLSYPMFASFDDAGRLYVFESTGPNTMSTEDMLHDPPYHIRVVEDVDGDGIYDRSHIFADDIPFPMGGVFYRGSLYVAAPPNLVRLADTDGDDVADEREVILTGWTLNHNGAILSGPFLGPDGWLYLADARRGFRIESKEGEILEGQSARIWRVKPDGAGLESMSGGGFDNSIELIFMPSGETIGTMTYFVDPQHGLRDALMHWVEGGVYPKPHPVIEADAYRMTGGLMPVMTKLPRVAPSGLMRYRGTALGADFDGDLFSAQFNTGRVMRHEIVRDGASFRTEDAPFMTSTSADTHPTDVLQDADGSLLVLDTGGWFIEGCPLSRVAKPSVQGGIYRIRKIDAPVVEDPWGRKLNLDSMPPEDLVAHMDDPRPFVRDRAVEALVALRGTAVGPLEGLLRSDRPHAEDAAAGRAAAEGALGRPAAEDVRASAVFALSRIGTPHAMRGVRAALGDRSVTVRTAAARALGLAGDAGSVDPLMTMVRDDGPPARRQAATALGQIGARRAVGALLEASADPDDRFVEHAVIYALIRLEEEQPLLDALTHPIANVRKAALIALDQMDDSPLERDHVGPFLASADAQLRSTGVWVASHHPDWEDVVLDFVDNALRRTSRLRNETQSAGESSVQTGRPAPDTESEIAAVRDLMTTFCGAEQMQALIARHLEGPDTATAARLMLMDVIDRCNVKELPDTWVRALGGLLQDGDGEVRSRVLALIASRSITALHDELDRIVRDPEAPIDARLDAVDALTASRPQLSEMEFDLLVEHLDPAFEPPIRQQAARILGQAELVEPQLLALARGPLVDADLFLLPRLVDAFEGGAGDESGKALVEALSASEDRLDRISEQDLRTILASYPASVRAAAEPLIADLRRRHARRLSRLQELESRLPAGDVAEGRELFFGKALCSTCHAVGAEGGNFGPDLTNIGEIRSRHDLLEAILYPDASFAREYDTYRVETRTNTYTGIISEQLQDAVIVDVAPETRIRVPRADVASIEAQASSMMPPGLDQQLTTDEMADLMTFLEALPYRLDRLIEARERPGK